MAVMARETWTDERLDDLKEGMNGRFDRVEAEMKEGFAGIDKKMGEGFAQTNKRFDRVEADVRELRGDINGMQRLMIQGFIGISTLMFTCFGILAGISAF